MHKCVDCQKQTANKCIRCWNCYIKWRENPKNHPNYKDGISLKQNYCKDCNAKINYRAIRCKKCDNLNRKIKYKGENNPAYIDGRTIKKYYCKICNKKLSGYQIKSELCKSCETKERYKNPLNHPNFNNGISLKINNCIDCKKELSDYRAIRCSSCETIRRLKTGILSIKPNKPETILINILRDKFRYVGNGKFWIESFNPDFVDIKNRKIIELFGDYWHNRPENIERDKLRLKAYKHKGYKTIIIWEHELKDLNKLSIKLRKF